MNSYRHCVFLSTEDLALILDALIFFRENQSFPDKSADLDRVWHLVGIFENHKKELYDTLEEKDE